MALYYGKHKVRDYDQWRPYFDADQDRLRKVGAKCLRVMQSTDDPNEVHFLFEVSDLYQFLEELQGTGDLMKKAGVIEQPWLYRLESILPELTQQDRMVAAHHQ
ncbi:MAG: hypothetical protein ACM3VS_01850 [Candidatus Dadabacteria bacterium]